MISFIVPVYKTPLECLKRCVESILTYPGEYEIVCILDSPGDPIEEFLDGYSSDGVLRLYKNVKNEGVAYSRNFGIEKARGDYIAFVDADDAIIGANYFKITEKMSEHCLDVCALITRECGTGGFGLANGEFVYSAGADGAAAFTNAVMMIGIGSYSAVYRKSYLINNQCRFPIGITNNEDFVFATHVITADPKIRIGAYCIHAYMIIGHSESTTRTRPTSQRYMSIIKAQTLVMKDLIGVRFPREIMLWYIKVSVGQAFVDFNIYRTLDMGDIREYKGLVNNYIKAYCTVASKVLNAWSVGFLKALNFCPIFLPLKLYLLLAYAVFVRRCL